jgi:SAM-dependent methyltransferase
MGGISAHYTSGGPYQQISAALDTIAPGGGPIPLDELGGFDDFHTAGRVATVRMGDLLAPAADETVLDAGCGLGGPARFLADCCGCRVIGVDLTPEFIDIARLINARTGMDDQVEVRVGDITALDLADESVDHAWTQHVAMNIADRETLYAETRRVMRRGGRFVLFDVIDGGGGELILPVPWATRPEHSHLVKRDRLRELLEGAGFRIDVWDDPTTEMMEVLRTMYAAQPPATEPPVLGARLFIDDLGTKMGNYTQNMAEGRTELVLAACTAT